MGSVIIKSKFECCISDSTIHETEETEENILEEGIEPLKETIETFETLPVF